MSSLIDRLKGCARTLGFDLVGVAPAATPDGVEWLRAWLAENYAGEMSYMHRHAAARADPHSVFPDVRTVVMVGMNYRTPAHQPDLPEGQITGRVSCYAWGDDYHDLLRTRLNELLTWLQQEVPACQGRAVVDTAPLMERDFARLAGLGWFGKNTMLLHPRHGSYFFLGALLVNLDLPVDNPFSTSHCGTCTACLDACPTQAFVGPGQLDARRCISYLTIELRGPIPLELRTPMGSWIFGCDICQDVCPWNRKAPFSSLAAFQPRPGLAAADLIELLRLSPDQFRQRFRGSTMTRPKRSGLLRNVAIALGNSGAPQAVPVLVDALQDEEPLIRGAAAWALGRLGGNRAREALQARRCVEMDTEVNTELREALTSLPCQKDSVHS